jgi:predicted glycoside hydrolase/deacetylase ChbG (UPF0249 family)
MSIPPQIIVNADDIGLKTSVNKAILYCFEQGYINSTSLLTNMDNFDEAVDLIHANPIIKNIGVHVNFAEGKPVSGVINPQFLDTEGNWDINKTGSTSSLLNNSDKAFFRNEVNAQIDRALSAKINIVHLDSHLHLHTLPCFYNLFIDIARQRKLRLRLAQTYKEDSYLKFYYRKYINNKIKTNAGSYSDLFETVEMFTKNTDRALGRKIVEIMVHPDFDGKGRLFDHVDNVSINNWISYLNNK